MVPLVKLRKAATCCFLLQLGKLTDLPKQPISLAHLIPFSCVKCWLGLLFQEKYLLQLQFQLTLKYQKLFLAL